LEGRSFSADEPDQNERPEGSQSGQDKQPGAEWHRLGRRINPADTTKNAGQTDDQSKRKISAEASKACYYVCLVHTRPAIPA
jgi:hypothetical protein